MPKSDCIKVQLTTGSPIVAEDMEIQPMLGLVYFKGTAIVCQIAKTTLQVEVQGVSAPCTIYSEPLNEPVQFPCINACKFLDLVGEWNRKGKLDDVEILELDYDKVAPTKSIK
jgi:hypothetical protein